MSRKVSTELLITSLRNRLGENITFRSFLAELGDPLVDVSDIGLNQFGGSRELYNDLLALTLVIDKNFILIVRLYCVHFNRLLVYSSNDKSTIKDYLNTGKEVLFLVSNRLDSLKTIRDLDVDLSFDLNQENMYASTIDTQYPVKIETGHKEFKVSIFDVEFTIRRQRQGYDSLKYQIVYNGEIADFTCTTDTPSYFKLNLVDGDVAIVEYNNPDLIKPLTGIRIEDININRYTKIYTASLAGRGVSGVCLHMDEFAYFKNNNTINFDIICRDDRILPVNLFGYKITVYNQSKNTAIVRMSALKIIIEKINTRNGYILKTDVGRSDEPNNVTHRQEFTVFKTDDTKGQVCSLNFNPDTGVLKEVEYTG